MQCQAPLCQVKLLKASRSTLPTHCNQSCAITQKKILRLATKKDTPAADKSMMDELCSHVCSPSETNCTASVQVDASLLRFIVGNGGKVKEKIENDTTTQLQIPPPRKAKRGSCLVVIKGSSQTNVDNAVSQIRRVLEEAVESPSLEYSHFISLPLALHPDLVVQVARFHDSVMALFPAKQKDETGHGVEESIFIKPATFHLTVLMLKLWSKERVAAAAEVLQGLHAKLLEALDNRPVAVRLKGVECMRGSPAKAHVLYAKVEDADEEKKNRLLGACKVLRDAFVEAGLVSEKDKKQELKLHATLMNTSHRKRNRGKKFGERMPFDARPILSKHRSEEWGEYTITEAHLSERFVYDEDGYYHCCGSVKFPTSALSTRSSSGSNIFKTSKCWVPQCLGFSCKLHQ